MKKTALVILICIIGIIFFYCYQQFVEQNKKNEKIITDCESQTINSDLTFSSSLLNSNTTTLFLNNKKLKYVQNVNDKSFLINVKIILIKNTHDTLFIKDDQRTIKVYNFDVDTMIINKKQNIECGLKYVNVNGKKQFARDIIMLD